MKRIICLAVLTLMLMLCLAASAADYGTDHTGRSAAFRNSAKDAKAYADEITLQDKLLNDAYGRAVKMLPQNGKKMLRDAQRAWIDWREKDAKLLALIPAAAEYAREDDLRKMTSRVSFLSACADDAAETDSGSLEDSALSAEYERAIDSASSPGESVGAAEDEFKRQDKLLNENYNALRKALSKEQSGALKTAQLAWIKWRDADGEFFREIGNSYAADKALKTAYRAKFLASLIGITGGSTSAKPQSRSGGKEPAAVKEQDGAPLIRVTMTASDVNVRSEPSTKARSFGKVNKGDAFIAERQTVNMPNSGTDGWYKIIFPVDDINDGYLPRYVAARFAKAGELAAGDAERIAATAIGRNYDLNISAKSEPAAPKKSAPKRSGKPEAKTPAAKLGDGDALVRLTVTADDVNVRSEPNTSGEQLAKANSGDAFIAERWAFEDAKGGKWYRIIFAADKVGDDYEDRYISADLVSVSALTDDDRAAVAGTLYGKGGGDVTPLGANDLEGFFSRAGNVFGRNIADVVRKFGPGEVSASWVDWFAAEVFEQDDLAVQLRPWNEGATVSFTVSRKGFDVLGIVIGTTTQDDVRRMMGAPSSANDSETIDGIVGEFIGWHWEDGGGVADIYFSKATGRVAVIGLGWEI